MKNGSHLKCHSWKNESHLKDVSQLEKWVTLKKLSVYSCKNESHLKNVSQLEKWVTRKKSVAVEKMGHT